MAESYFGELIKHGVKVYRYTPGFLHGKSIMVGRAAAFVGSANMDYRSFELDYECGVMVCGAPMIGFLGTVIGMVQAFYAIASQGTSANISTFSSGIYTALVTTVAGLVVGGVALFAYNYLVARINSVMNLLESKSMEFMDLLNEPAS